MDVISLFCVPVPKIYEDESGSGPSADELGSAATFQLIKAIFSIKPTLPTNKDIS